ncbi:MAG: phosphotransferase [Porticoccaceae bacterium]|nr:phosphotransferase [Porticoccaceae bacterium]
MQNKRRFSHWIQCSLPANISVPSSLKLEALAGDAGFRRYYRLNTQPSLIAVNSPPLKEKNPAYVNIALFLQAEGVRTPKIYAVNFEQGYILLEDFGERLFQHELCLENQSCLYDKAESTLLEIQNCPVENSPTPDYNHQKLAEELALFERWFVRELLGIRLGADEKATLDQLFEQLIDNALQQPQFLVHSDYHSRNLMLLEDDQIGVIDFQDAMRGAITYDLVSLLKDCYVRWPATWVKQRALNFKQRLEKEGTLVNIDDKQFMQWFDLMGLQRHIKVLGIFARLALRDHKKAYLQDIPLVVRYCLEAADGYRKTAEFSLWFKQAVVPLLTEQSWYQEHRDAEL